VSVSVEFRHGEFRDPGSTSPWKACNGGGHIFGQDAMLKSATAEFSDRTGFPDHTRSDDSPIALYPIPVSVAKYGQFHRLKSMLLD
jgi:hypothetical protein